MTIITLNLKLSDEEAQEAAALGLLDNAYLTEIVESEIKRGIARPRMSRAEFIAWLEATPPPEAWGGLRDDEDAAEFIHNQRQQSIDL
jgi:hypothetical protein